MAKKKTKSRKRRLTGMAAAMAVKPKPAPKVDREAVALLNALIRNSRDLDSAGIRILTRVVSLLKG